jgi:hypothetical protein
MLLCGQLEGYFLTCFSALWPGETSAVAVASAVPVASTVAASAAAAAAVRLKVG